ncbi:hypothetical protein [Akkermansia muciniphila]|uniref:hypothetical protein n=1 Tax=Akkermansia muciniphila TaxID=239935 RepID=UPI0011787385|nr:hypothetical protein [Akkermansia muciniphila]WMB14998.1 hypothetical protein O4G22_09960 [Akkermansia muciniphila]
MALSSIYPNGSHFLTAARIPVISGKYHLPHVYRRSRQRKNRIFSHVYLWEASFRNSEKGWIP